MKKIYFTIIATIMLAVSIQNSWADTPVMIIRFNQNIVEYERPLAKVVKAAIDKKPEVFFDVVSLVPKSDSKNNNQEIKDHVEYLTNKVVEKIKYSGVEQNNVRVTYQNSDVISESEVHIFVR
jgi:hypothetical protein